MLEFVVSLLTTLGLAPLIRQLMLRQGILDVPNHRSSHAVVTPRGGGIACLAGIVIAAALSSLMSHVIPWYLICASAIMAILGFIEDKRGLSVMTRLGAQLAVGAGVGAAIAGEWWILLAIIVMPIAVNVVNFMDGINGITSLTMICWGTNTLIVGLQDGLPQLATLGALTAGAALGFLPWNAPRARLFLGDVGSYLYGALVAGGTLYGSVNGASTVILLAPLTLYVADSGTTILRRLSSGQSILEAHRDHVYQRLVSEVGMSHLAVASLLTVLATAITLAWQLAGLWTGLVLTGVVTSIYLSTLHLAERTRRK